MVKFFSGTNEWKSFLCRTRVLFVAKGLWQTSQSGIMKRSNSLNQIKQNLVWTFGLKIKQEQWLKLYWTCKHNRIENFPAILRKRVWIYGGWFHHNHFPSALGSLPSNDISVNLRILCILVWTFSWMRLLWKKLYLINVNKSHSRICYIVYNQISWNSSCQRSIN